jgi:hypothetical protein
MQGENNCQISKKRMIVKADDLQPDNQGKEKN